MVEEFFATLVWLAANGLYIDMKRKGREGIVRIIFFWMGVPLTWLWFFLVPKRKDPKELPANTEDDYLEILQEIRKEKALRPGDRPGEGEPEQPADLP
jgi:hypothetical protein